MGTEFGKVKPAGVRQRDRGGEVPTRVPFEKALTFPQILFLQVERPMPSAHCIAKNAVLSEQYGRFKIEAADIEDAECQDDFAPILRSCALLL